MLDFHRLNEGTCTSIFYNRPDTISADEDESKLFTGLETKTSTLLYTKSEADITDQIEIRMSMLWKFPNVNITTRLSDLHFYIFQRWVLDVVSNETRISSIQSDLLPLLLKCQFQSLLLTKYKSMLSS